MSAATRYRGNPVAYQPRTRPLRVVFGVIYLVIGLGFMFDSLHVLAVHAVDLWPLALVAIGTWVWMGRAERAKVEEDRSAQLAVAEERVRIARELHDIVAHSVSLMTIQIAAARRVQHTQPEDADEALANAEQTGRRSPSELRSMLSMLRVSGIEPDAAGSVGLAVFRVIQEALTNAMRHAPGAHVQVEVTYAPGFIVLFVDDDGAGAAGGRSGPDHRPRAGGCTPASPCCPARRDRTRPGGGHRRGPPPPARRRAHGRAHAPDGTGSRPPGAWPRRAMPRC